jgi:(R,R)-butanediol dehydrogenase/meso-butanediol dehydrogenase/diacetyl reductase
MISPVSESVGEQVGELMPASVYVGDGRLTVDEVPIPELAPGEVRIEISHCGICGTDLHLVLEHIARPGSILGHEWAGTIVELGAGVDGWAVGERVVAGPVPGCGVCRACRRGRPSVCLERPLVDHLAFRGAFARYVRADAARLLRVPDTLSTRAAALTEPVAIALHAVRLSGVTPDDRVLITGAGPVGMLILAVLRARGIDDVTVSEPAPARRARALEVGAARVIEPDDLPPGPMGRPVDEPYSVVFECSGKAAAAERALDQVDFAGTFVFVGTGHDQPRVNHNRVIILELELIGAYNYDAEGWQPALDLLASGKLPIDALIDGDDVLLDGLLPAMERLAAGEIPAKVMVRPEVST